MGLSLIGQAAWTSSRVLRSLYFCLCPAFSLSRFLPLVYSLAHTLAASSILHLLTPLLYLLYPVEFSLSTCSSSYFSPLSMSVSFLICLRIISGDPSKVTPLPDISPSSSLTHVFNIFSLVL